MAEILRVVVRAPRPVRFPASGWLWTRVEPENATTRLEIWECNLRPTRMQCAFVVPTACLWRDGRWSELRPGVYSVERVDSVEAPTLVITQASEFTADLVLFVVGAEVTDVRSGHGVVLAHAKGAGAKEPRLSDHWALVAATPGSVIVGRVSGILFAGETRARVTQDGLELAR
jgi:hypothetical protein